MNITRVICAGVLLLAGSVAAQEGGKPIQKTTISLGTATPGGGFPLYGNALAQGRIKRRHEGVEIPDDLVAQHEALRVGTLVRKAR